MSVSEERVLRYRRLRRMGHSVQVAEYLTSKPRYDVYPAIDCEYRPGDWARTLRAQGDPIDVFDKDGRSFLIVFVYGSEPYDWSDLEPTEDDRANVVAVGVCVVELAPDGVEGVESVWQVDYDERLPHWAADRYCCDVACDLIDERMARPRRNLAPLLLGA